MTGDWWLSDRRATATNSVRLATKAATTRVELHPQVGPSTIPTVIDPAPVSLK